MAVALGLAPATQAAPAAGNEPASESPTVPGEQYDPALPEESPEATAIAEARATGEAVEVVSQRGEAREVFATPDGDLEAREYVVPVWSRVAGEWQRVDLDLAATADGRIAPTAATVDVTFSAGGDDELVVLSKHGREFALDWPGELPEPVLAQERATYRDVLPGVDLRMEAVPDGFFSLLVVKNAEAAANPELEKIRFELETSGLRVETTPEGGLTALDAGSGGVVFEAPTPLMWDSSTPAATEGGAQARAAAPAVDAAETPAPSDSSRLAEVELEVDSDGSLGELVLGPDLSVLRGEDVQYPVYIDPQTHSPRASAWTMVSRHWSGSPQWKFNGRADEGLGYCVGWSGCNPNEVKRLFYRIDTSRFAGTRVQKAEFVVRNTHSAQCTAHPVQLWRTKGITSSTTWNTQQASGFWIERLRTSSFHYGGNPQQGCRPAGDAEFDITSAVQKAADSRTSTMTFGLRASNESSNLHWKRFSKDAHLRVTYNRPPARIKPSQITLEYGGTCKPQSNPAIARSLGNVHANNVTDPDGDSVRVQFRVRWSGGVWDAPLTSAKRSGSSFSLKLPNHLPQNSTLRLYARAYDGSHYGPWSEVDGHPCYFRYDTSVPAAPTITSDRYPEFDPSGTDIWYQGAGHYGGFTFTAADRDVNRYRYGINNDPTAANQVATSSGAARSVSVLPEEPGLHFVTVQALDQAGNISEVRTYQFLVSPGESPRAAFSFDEGPDAAAAEPDVPQHDATLTGGYALGVPGVVGTALQLDGETGHAAVEGPVVDTGKPFTVSTWARLDTKSAGSSVVVEQTGRNFAGFTIYHSGHYDQWAVLAQRSDDPAGTARSRILADAPVTTGTWTHLAASYDGTNLRFFVNGRLAGTTPHTSAWSAQTSLQIGASRRGSVVSEHLGGSVDQLQFFDYAMTTASGPMAQLYDKQAVSAAPHRPATAVFPFDEPAGTTAATGTADHGPAVYHGGVRTGRPGANEYAATFNGTDSYAVTEAPIVDTSRDFSVSAWARLDKSRAEGAGIIAAQLGADAPGLELYYSKGLDRWAFNQYRSDTPSAGPVRAAQPAGTVAQDGEWVHLVGVHDSVADTLTLYVNGVQAGRTTRGGAWDATGPVMIGAGSYSGDIRSHFPGDIDDVRFYSRVVTPTEVGQLLKQNPLLTARWELNAGSTTSPDASPNENHLTLHGGHEFGPGRHGDALLLDGATGYAQTAGVPLDTTASVSAAAWVQAAAAPEEPVTVLSAAGNRQNALAVRFLPHSEEPGWGSWQVAVAEEDDASSRLSTAVNQLFYDIRDWNHLALVYDGSTKRASLYVNGSLQEIVCTEDSDESCVAGSSWTDNALTFKATHSFQLGRQRSGSGWSEYWPGAIDDVWLYQGVLSAAQVLATGFGDSIAPGP
ncbi:LamG-like jellyroll fold domain-containing protein [Streptomyces bohaiensis]|uniref:LamG-like jellyroll fold domain-containing protein n=1 Tax=Streptomyces bohaiensis TaxID=1431344 RepID=UPI003BA20AED